MTLRDKLIATKFKRKAFDVDGESLYVRSFSIAERDWWLYESRRIVINNEGSPEDLRANTLIKCLQDEGGKPVFQPEDKEHVKRLPVGQADAYYDSVLVLSGLMEDPEDAKKNE